MNSTSAVECSVVTDVSKITVIPGVPTQLPLANVTVANGQVICYNATQTITVAGNGTYYTIQPGGSATMIAGQNIIYYSGTTVLAGGYLHGYLAPGGPYCGAPLPIPASLTGQDELRFVPEQPFFSLYPNPTAGGFSLELRGLDETAELKVEIYGIFGDRVFSAVLNGKRKYDFSLAEKPVGVYFIRVVSGKHAGTGKIIKH
jgi:hypothetical protein